MISGTRRVKGSSRHGSELDRMVAKTLDESSERLGKSIAAIMARWEAEQERREKKLARSAAKPSETPLE